MMLEIARYMLEFEVASEAGAQPDPKEDDLDRGSLSSVEIQRLQGVFPGANLKSTYRAVNGKTPIQTLDWTAIAMTSFDFEDNPFQGI